LAKPLKQQVLKMQLSKDAPTKEDPDFSPEDIRYSVIRYVASTTRNAVGPSVSDLELEKLLRAM
jgi:hypothetical protein